MAHENVVTWIHFPHCCPSVRGNHIPAPVYPDAPSGKVCGLMNLFIINKKGKQPLNIWFDHFSTGSVWGTNAEPDGCDSTEHHLGVWSCRRHANVDELEPEWATIGFTTRKQVCENNEMI